MAQTTQSAAFSSTAVDRTKVGNKRPEGYSRHWEQDGEALPDDEDARNTRKQKYEELVNDYYDAATDLYLESWGQSFHMCRYPRGPENKEKATARHEHYLAHMISLRPGMRVLDVGCGVGGPAKELAAFAGCQVVGLNNNGYQVRKAAEMAKAEGMEKMVEFVKGDFMDIPFSDAEFDAAFALEATVHAPSLQDVYAQVYRVLRPGSVFGVFEWVLTDNYVSGDPAHEATRSGIERGNGIPSLQTKAVARAAMKNAGFELLVTEDLAEKQDEIPWWYPISGDVKHAKGFKDWLLVIRNTQWGRVGVKIIVRILETVRVAPKGTLKMTEEFITAADALIDGGKKGIFTPMFLMVARKPDA
ncbi:putative tocopherol O-methyltransferase [Paraphaeosphaeria sporulosa]|uniref:Sterol 24-C-methyltransferase n=1 Tax=Paraphaeosphaeria sporulosa TaxID=1460663 RepID=A0A177CB82_9PLEO|nr:putative tocopherol O-methyltransferase [Paraphaeosphaeria sporulosa]OAG03970.1 putative tocopherol O-methyltransferase [Paraphaeosphaeria sporulosa]